jgi:hypothetical protein
MLVNNNSIQKNNFTNSNSNRDNNMEIEFN